MDHLPRMILATVCYADVLDKALSAFEVWKYLMLPEARVPEQYRRPRCLREVVETLDSLVQSGRLSFRNGFYTLPDRETLVEARVEKDAVSARKLLRLRQAIKFLRFVPFVRQIWVTGTLAAKNAAADSDWDILLVVRGNYIWTARALITVLTHLSGRRRHGRYHRDRLCLNYFITTASLEISLKDRFSSWEYMFARCLFASVNPRKFLERNAWIRRWHPNYDELFVPSTLFVSDNGGAYFSRRTGEFLLAHRFLEDALRTIQRWKIMRNPKTRRKGGVIVVNDKELVFLPSPHAPQAEQKYEKLARLQGI